MRCNTYITRFYDYYLSNVDFSEFFFELFLQNIVNMCRVVHDVIRYVVITRGVWLRFSAASLNDDDDNPDLDCGTTTENNAMWTTTVQIC